MFLLNKIRLKLKLSLMMILPLLGLAILASWQIVDNLRIKKNADLILEVTTFISTTSRMLHELQSERSMAAVVISSRGKKFKDEYSAQLVNTDSSIEDFKQALNTFGVGNDEQFHQSIEQSSELLEQLNQLRQKIQAKKIRSIRYLKTYDELASLTLDISNILPRTAKDSPLGVLGAAYISFMHARELVAIEMAVLADVFQKDEFPPGAFKRFTTLMTSQQAYLSMFKSLATTDQLDYFGQVFQGEVIDETNRMRESAFAASDYGAFGIEPEYWFEQQSAKLALMRQIEDQLTTELVNRAQSIQSDSNDITAFSIILTAIILALTLVGMILIQKSILTPVNAMLKSVSELASGEGDLTIHLKARGKDEISELAQGFNDFITTVRNIVVRVSQTSGDLMEVSENVQKSSSEVINSIQTQKTQADQATQAMGEMRGISANVVDITKQAADHAISVDQRAKSGSQELEKTLTMIDSLASAIEEAADSMHRQTQQGERIGSVLETIRGIAEQTNLLALNAAIEAARAGEQGRGFAVVADEVRALSAKTEHATDEIQAMIKAFQQETLQVATTISDKKVIAEDSVNQARSARDSFNAILAGIHEIEKTSTRIAESAREQKGTCVQVSDNLSAIEQASNANVAQAQDSEKLSTNLIGLAQELRGLITRFKV